MAGTSAPSTSAAVARDPRIRPRTGWGALLLTLAWPGLGHLYAGKPVRGFVLIGLSAAAYLLWIILAPSDPLSNPLAHLGWMLLAGLGLFALAGLDCWFAATSAGETYRLRPYNHALIYVLTAVLLGGGCVALLRVRYRAFLISSGAMSPTASHGSYLLADAWAYSHRSPQRGEAVLFVSPKDNSTTWIMRVIAVAGDRISLKDDEVFINGGKLPHNGQNARRADPIPYQDATVLEEVNGGLTYEILLQDSGYCPEELRSMPEQTVPLGHCFVLGDSRHSADDSRRWGPLAVGRILGRAQVVCLPDVRPMQRMSRPGG